MERASGQSGIGIRRSSPSDSDTLAPLGASLQLYAPTNLTVTAQPDRANVLQWSAPGERGTQFAIEAAVGKIYRGSAVLPDAGAYKLVATVTDEHTFRHVVASAPAGVHVKYRLRALRDGRRSPFCAEVTVTCK
jgi:hypothetical protein